MSDAGELASVHSLFARLLERNGPPPLWRRPATFSTLVRLVLEQQVSLASAGAAFARLEARVGEVTPDAVLASTPAALRADGFSRQKAGYVVGMAALIDSGSLDPASIAREPETANEELLAIRGIGPWTAACFRLFVMGDPDVWPTGDRALYVSMKRNLGLDAVPAAEVADAMAADWGPYRSTAARMLWHDYLGGRSYTPSPNTGFA